MPTSLDCILIADNLALGIGIVPLCYLLLAIPKWIQPDQVAYQKSLLSLYNDMYL